MKIETADRIWNLQKRLEVLLSAHPATTCWRFDCPMCRSSHGDWRDVIKERITQGEIENIRELVYSTNTTRSLFPRGSDYLDEIVRIYADDLMWKIRQLQIEAYVDNLDLSDVRTVDDFLFHTRDNKPEKYDSVVVSAINIACSTLDESLIETLLVILGKSAREHEELVSSALEQIGTSKKIHRVMYNLFREDMLEVRGFVGDGSSTVPW